MVQSEADNNFCKLQLRCLRTQPIVGYLDRRPSSMSSPEATKYVGRRLFAFTPLFSSLSLLTLYFPSFNLLFSISEILKFWENFALWPSAVVQVSGSQLLWRFPFLTTLVRSPGWLFGFGGEATDYWLCTLSSSSIPGPQDLQYDRQWRYFRQTREDNVVNGKYC